MKGMTKIALVSIVALLVALTGVAAFGLPTQADVPVGLGDAPIVKAKWEIVTSAAPDLDDDPSKDWTQVDAPGTYQGTKTIGYWMVITDPNGFGDLTNKAYVDVDHPDGTDKYQVELTEKYDECPEDDTEIDEAIAAITAADAAGLVTYGTGYDLADVIEELEQCSAKAFYGEADLDYHQMCGEFTWVYPCCSEPYVTNFATGYEVVGYAFDKYNVKSADLTNYFEYICSSGIELDFDSLDFGSVVVSSNKWVEGNTVFDSFTCIGTADPCSGIQTGPLCDAQAGCHWEPNFCYNQPGATACSEFTGTSESTCEAQSGCTWSSPACAPGPEGCRAPTVRNIGNIPSLIDVTFDDMDFGYSGPADNKNWNVKWDARLGLLSPVYFDPYVTTTLPGATLTDDGVLGLCNTQKISFSIHVKKAVTTGDKEGTVTIDSKPDPNYQYNP